MMKWLTSSWKVARIFGVEIRLHFSVLFIILGAFSIFRPMNWSLGLLALLACVGFVLSIFLHELGHALTAKIAKVEVKSIVLWFLGGFTTLSHEPEKPWHRIAIYAAGPFVTILLGVFFFVAYIIASFAIRSVLIYVYARLFLFLAVLNIVLFVFNILPVYPFDGGRILHALSESLFGQSKANLITMIVSVPILLGLILLGIKTHDYLLLASSIFIALAIGTLNRHTLHWINLSLSYLFRRGGYYFLQGDYYRAAQYCTRDIERDPKQVNHYVARALSYLWMMQKAKALADIERALEIAPNNALVLTIRGDMYALDKEYDAALDLFSKAQELNPKWAPPYIDRGSILLDKQEFQPALEELDKGISLNRQIPLSYVIRSRAYFRLGNLEAAHRDQDLALSLSEKDALTRADFSVEDNEGNLDWAEDYYGRVLLTRPRSWYAYLGRADAYRANREYDKAIADYARALEINPREPRLYLSRGKSYQAKGDVESAAKDFRQVSAVTNKLHLTQQAEESLKSLKSE